MKKAWPREICPATPVSRLRPRAATAKITAWVVRRIQSASPRKRTNGSWLMIGRLNGSRIITTPNSAMRVRCVHVGKMLASAR